MAKQKKYYVVWNGVQPGIYDSWAECKLQITGYPDARYKAFKSKAEAEEAYSGGPGSVQSKTRKTRVAPAKDAKIQWKSIAVDAACSGNPGDLEYRGVHTKTGEEIFRQGPFKEGTNNIGEFLALVHALALLQKKGETTLPIYSDSRTAMAWVRNKKVNSNLKKTNRNAKLFDLVDRALHWLKNNSYKNPIEKWETRDWGEIPADFGRK